MEYRQLKQKDINEWVKGLIAEKGGPKQVDLLKKTLDFSQHKYVDYIEKSIARDKKCPYENKQATVPSLLVDGKKKVFELTNQHMHLMPPESIVKLYRHWKEIPYVIASMPTFWGAVTLQAIRDQVVKPSWLATNHAETAETVKSKIDKALKSNDTKSKDLLVRRILRLMMGPGQMRGTPELYANCSFAKAWWCGRLAYDCSRDATLELEIDEAATAIAEIWPEFSDYLAGRLTVVGQPSVYRGLALWTKHQIDGDKPRLTRKQIRNILHRIGEISTWCMLGLKTPQDIEVLVDRINSLEKEDPAQNE